MRNTVKWIVHVVQWFHCRVKAAKCSNEALHFLLSLPTSFNLYALSVHLMSLLLSFLWYVPFVLIFHCSLYHFIFSQFNYCECSLSCNKVIAVQLIDRTDFCFHWTHRRRLLVGKLRRLKRKPPSHLLTEILIATAQHILSWHSFSPIYFFFLNAKTTSWTTTFFSGHQ